MGCTYVKEFDFGKKSSDGTVKYSKGGSVKAPGFKGGTMLSDKSKLGISGNKNPGIKGPKPVAPNLPTLKLAKGGSVHTDEAMDKTMVKTAVHKHEKAMHKGEPLTKLKRGGPVMEKATGESYPSREAMVRHEAKETPRMQREELVQRSKVVGPARRSVPVASAEPMLALKSGGKVSQAKVGKVMSEFKSGDLHAGKNGKVVTKPKQAIAIALSEGRKAAKR